MLLLKLVSRTFHFLRLTESNQVVKSRKRSRRSRLEGGELGFQIAPMIDVVFVIMLFFMVMAGAVKVERELNTKLPGTAETSGPTEMVDEAIITISDAGEVSLNDEPM